MKNNIKSKLNSFKILSIFALVLALNSFCFATSKKDDDLAKGEDKIVKTQVSNLEKFNKKAYEQEGFQLVSLYKFNGLLNLHFIHKETMAPIVIGLVEDEEDLNKFSDYMYYRAGVFDDSGIIHLAEHLLAYPIVEENFKKDGNVSMFNAYTDNIGLKFGIISKYGDSNFFKRLAKDLIKPPIFEKENRKKFDVEKKRIINEIKNSNKGNEDIPFREKFFEFESGGTVSTIKEVSFEKLEKFYKDYIHPSNMLVIKRLVNSPKKVREFLKTLDENYLKHYTYKEFTPKYRYKNKDSYKMENFYDTGLQFRSGYKKYKFNCEINFDIPTNKKLNGKNLDALFLDFDIKNNKKYADFIHSLGYDLAFFGGNVYDERSRCIRLYGNKEEAFKEEVLKENVKKILSFVKNLAEKLDDEQLKEKYFGFDRMKQEAMKDKSRFKGADTKIETVMCTSYFYENEPFSTKFFDIKKGNDGLNLIKNSEESVLKNIKENLDVFDILKETKPYILVLKADKNMKYKPTSKKTKEGELELPYRVKEYNNNYDLYQFSMRILRNILDFSLGKDKDIGGLIYSSIYEPKYDFGLLRITDNEDAREELLKFLKNNFNKVTAIIEKNIKDKDFKKYLDVEKEKYKNRKKKFSEWIDDAIKQLKDFSNKAKSYINKKTVKQFHQDLHEFCHEGVFGGITIRFKDKNAEHKFYDDSGKCFWEKLKKLCDSKGEKEDKVDSKLIEFFEKEFVDKYLKEFNENKKMAERAIKNVDNLKYEDVIKALKSFSYVGK